MQRRIGEVHRLRAELVGVNSSNTQSEAKLASRCSSVDFSSPAALGQEQTA